MKSLFSMLIFGLALTFSSLTSASTLHHKINQQLSSSPIVRGSFEQQKTIRGVSKPLLSKGDFVVWRGHGVIWQTNKPFASTLRISKNTLQAWQGNQSNQKTLDLDTRQDPSLKVIHSLLFAIFSGDLNAMQSYFKLENQSFNQQNWQLTLTPIHADFSRLITRVTLEGNRHIQSLILLDGNGDKSMIRFSNLTDANTPTSAEEKYFAE